MDAELDTIWKALSDPTRRRLLDLLRSHPLTTGELAAAVPELSRFGVMKHLGVLTDAGLVIVRREGRKRWNHLNAVPLRRVYERWVSRYEDHWAGSLLGLKQVVEKSEGERTMATDQATDAPRTVRVEEQIEIDAPPSRVFDALIHDTGRWFWRGEDNTDPPSILEPVPGGRFYHEWQTPEGKAFELYAHVGLLKPNKQLRLYGAMSSRYAVASTIDIHLEERDGSTMLSVSHRISGEINEQEMDGYRSGWKNEFESLKRFVETGLGRGE